MPPNTVRGYACGPACGRSQRSDELANGSGVNGTGRVCAACTQTARALRACG
jgi:hypothetical protein